MNNTVEFLNIKVDKNFEAKAQKPINTQLNTPISIYINNIHYPNKYTSAIRSHCEKKTSNYSSRRNIIGLQILSKALNGNKVLRSSMNNHIPLKTR